MLFFNAEKDDAGPVRGSLFDQVKAMREASENRLLDLCAAVDDLIRNHEQGAVTAAIEEVAAALGQFLDANRDLKARERHAYMTAVEAVSGTRYAATVWAATRRNGQYSGLNLAHQVGVGAAQDAILRSREWFSGLKMHLGALRANPGLSLAVKTIDQIEQGIEASRRAFAEAVQTAGAEVYREPLQQANEMWNLCIDEWGCGPGFKNRVLGHLRRWFDGNSGLKDRLEAITLAMWDEKVIRPIERLARETSTAAEDDETNVIRLEDRRTEEPQLVSA